MFNPEHLGPEKSDSHTRAKHKFKLREHQAQNDELKNSFINRMIQQWDHLPASVVEADSVVAFKNSACSAVRLAATGHWCNEHPCSLPDHCLDLDLDSRVFSMFIWICNDLVCTICLLNT